MLAFFLIVLQYILPIDIPTRCASDSFRAPSPSWLHSLKEALFHIVLLKEWSKEWNTMLYSKCNWVCLDKTGLPPTTEEICLYFYSLL